MSLLSTTSRSIRAEFATPPPKSKTGSGKSRKQAVDVDAKQLVLEDFDDEVDQRTKSFEQNLQTLIAAFKLKTEGEIARTPANLRSMTLGELEKYWEVGWAGIAARVASAKLAEERDAYEEKERLLREEVKGKRKRGTTTNHSPERNSKNARKAKTPLKIRPGLPSSASKRNIGGKKIGPFISSNPGQKGPSSLPQDHIFNPTLPPTPLRKMNPTDVLLTVNGSPIANPLSSRSAPAQTTSGPSRAGTSGTPATSRLYSIRKEPAVIQDENEDEEDQEGEEEEDGEEVDAEDLFRGKEYGPDRESGEDSDGDDLPDPEAYELHLAASQSLKSKSAPSRPKKRAPSLIFRPSLAGTSAVVKKDPTKSYLPYKGKMIEFDPLDLKPVELDLTMTIEKLSIGEKEEVRGLVMKEVEAVLDKKRQAWGFGR